MEKELRIQKLKEIETTQKPYMTGIRIMYGGIPKSFNAYKIPLDCLIYNKYNGRIGSKVKSYEKQFHTLDSENPEHVVKIEKFLWESKEPRNKGTMHDIVKKGQQKHGIVTNDGKIIDGNRRALLLNRIWRERETWQKHKNDVDHCRYFIAVILDEDMDRKELMRLETTWQMGEDEKLDYGPIEKYLKCKDLKAEFEDVDIAEMMTEKKSTIQKWLRIMELMDDYLDYFGYSGIYTSLDEREDLFIHLCEDLERLSKRGARHADWEYKETDMVDLKTISFDYIRTKFEGKEFRNICSAKE